LSTAGHSVPGGAGGAGGASVLVLLVETRVAGAGDTVEVGVGGAGGDGGAADDALSVGELESCVADASN
jgi:hypothetical protein